MKFNEVDSLILEHNKKNNLARVMSSYNSYINKILVVLTIGIIFALFLVSINPLIERSFKGFSFKNYFMLYLLIAFLFLSWTTSKILYENHCNGFRSKALLTKEIEKSKRVNAELMKNNMELKKLSYTDQLTAIPNRRSFFDFIESEYECKLNKKTLISIIMIDIDHFKQHNDNLGHGAADKILIEVAKEINIASKSITGIAARYGGDEFIIASINSDDKQIGEIANAIRNRVHEISIPNNKLDNLKNISVSIGTSTVIVTAKDDIFKCIELADKALYEAKMNGRNCVKSKPYIINKQNSKYYQAS